MSESNRVRLAYVEEASLGATPVAPTLRTARITGESLNFQITNTVSNELRADRMVSDLVQTGAQVTGDVSIELSHPVDNSFLGDMLAAVLFNTWTSRPERVGTPACGPVSGANTFGVASTSGFAARLLIATSGYSAPQNNGLFRIDTVGAGLQVAGTLVNEPATALSRIKVVGVEGAAGDVTATATGLQSTSLNFTSLGLAIGQFIKLGGAGAATRFATAANNGWARIAQITANSLTLDNRPTGWTAEPTTTGIGLQIFTGDRVANGTTRRSFTIERWFQDLANELVVMRGMVPARLDLTIAAQELVGGQIGFLGLAAEPTTATLGPADPATPVPVLNAVANVGRIAEAGETVGGANFIKRMTLKLDNSLRERQAIGTLGLVDVGYGRVELTGELQTYFGSSALYRKYLGGVETSLSIRLQAGSRVLVIQLPRVKFEGGRVNASGPNQDVMADMSWRAIRDPATEAMILIDRFDHVVQ
jgi:hypothetical protein